MALFTIHEQAEMFNTTPERIAEQIETNLKWEVEVAAVKAGTGKYRGHTAQEWIDGTKHRREMLDKFYASKA